MNSSREKPKVISHAEKGLRLAINSVLIAVILNRGNFALQGTCSNVCRYF